MGLVLDSSTLIAAEREKRPVSELLTSLESEHSEEEFLLSSITVMELEAGTVPIRPKPPIGAAVISMRCLLSFP